MHSLLRITILFFVFIGVSAASGEDLVHFPENDDFLPTSWIKKPIKAEIAPLEESLREQAQEIVERGLEKYPASVLKEFLDGVYIVGSLKFYDVRYGGTYMANAKRVVLVYRENFGAQGFEQRLHHEFSSILFKRNEALFDEKRWLRGNEPGFIYGGPAKNDEESKERTASANALAAEQKKTGGSGSTLLQLDPNLMSAGFLTKYNQVSIEQDLNETAAHLFTNPDLWLYCREHARIDHKVDVLIDFYRSINPEFDRIAFREMTEK